MKVLFAGGGTGGHLYPAIAIARAMVELDPRIEPFFVGAERGVERDVLPTLEFPFQLFDLHPLYRRQPWLNWKTALGGTRGYRGIQELNRAIGARAVVATGGYAASLALAFAARRRIPIVLQDQNRILGLTIRMFSRYARQIHLGFPEARATLSPRVRAEVFDSGNPITPPPATRLPRIEALAKWRWPDDGDRVLLVTGASQGAEAINRVVADWVWHGGPDRARCRVIWLTGPKNFATYTDCENARVTVLGYLEPMSDAYECADFAISRAGAMTTAELAAWGIPSLLVPLPTAAADHQTDNARAIAESGAAVFVPQNELNEQSLAGALSSTLLDPKALLAMHTSALRRARPNAAMDIARRVLTLPELQ